MQEHSEGGMEVVSDGVRQSCKMKRLLSPFTLGPVLCVVHLNKAFNAFWRSAHVGSLGPSSLEPWHEVVKGVYHANGELVVVEREKALITSL